MGINYPSVARENSLRRNHLSGLAGPGTLSQPLVWLADSADTMPPPARVDGQHRRWAGSHPQPLAFVPIKKATFEPPRHTPIRTGMPRLRGRDKLIEWVVWPATPVQRIADASHLRIAPFTLASDASQNKMPRHLWQCHSPCDAGRVSRETCHWTEPFRPFRPKFLQRVSRERYLRTEPFRPFRPTKKGPRIPPRPSANCRAVLFAPPSRRPWFTRFTRNLFNQCTSRTAK